VANLNTRGISQFKSKLSGGGARPNLFEVAVSFPPNVNQQIQGDNLNGGNFNTDDRFRFMCKSAALPASNVAPIDVPFRGRILKVAGDRTFDTWTVTVINDEDFYIRRSFEAWMQNVAQYENHSGMTNPGDYMGQATVYQLGRGASTEQRLMEHHLIHLELLVSINLLIFFRQIYLKLIYHTIHQIQLKNLLQNSKYNIMFHKESEVSDK
jgi:hypothetical protein